MMSWGGYLLLRMDSFRFRLATSFSRGYACRGMLGLWDGGALVWSQGAASFSRKVLMPIDAVLLGVVKWSQDTRFSISTVETRRRGVFPSEGSHPELMVGYRSPIQRPSDLTMTEATPTALTSSLRSQSRIVQSRPRDAHDWLARRDVALRLARRLFHRTSVRRPGPDAHAANGIRRLRSHLGQRRCRSVEILNGTKDPQGGPPPETNEIVTLQPETHVKPPNRWLGT